MEDHDFSSITKLEGKKTLWVFKPIVKDLFSISRFNICTKVSIFILFFSSIIFRFKYNKIYGESHTSLHCNLEEINLKVWKPKGWRNSWLRLLANLHIFNHLNESFFESIMHLWCLEWKEVNILSWSHIWQKSFNFLKNHDLHTNFCIERTCKIVRALCKKLKATRDQEKANVLNEIQLACHGLLSNRFHHVIWFLKLLQT